MTTPINCPSPEFAKHHARWKKNRDFAAGADAVKAAGTLYLPYPEQGMPLGSYEAFKLRANFYPAVSRTLDGWMGLVFRNDPVLKSPKVEPLKDALTANCDSLEELTEQLVRETMLTNWTGLLVDFPSAQPDGLNAANALEMGMRPFVALYPAESILDVEYGIVRNRRTIVRAVVLESETEVRELVLRNGIYQIDVHQETEDGLLLVRTDTPKRQGKALDFIPFQIVSTKNSRCPTKAMLQDAVDINHCHYELSADHRQALYMCGNPKYVLSGMPPLEQGQAEPTYLLGSSAVWVLRGADTSAAILSMNGENLVPIEREKADLKSQLAQVGARILADEKAVAEAAETLEIRRASESATLAGAVRTVARQLETALRWTAWWLGANDKQDPETRLSINTDFVPTRMSAQDLTAIVAATQAGYITPEELFYQLRKGEIIDEAITFEEHTAKLESSSLDSPSAL